MAADSARRAAETQWRCDGASVAKGQVRAALFQLALLWEQPFPADQARTVWGLVERVVVGLNGADIKLRIEGLTGLVEDLTSNVQQAAA